MACLSTVSVWTQTPETQSTTTRAPSVTRRAEVTVAGGVDQVDEETWLVGAVLLLGDGLLDESQILLVHVEEHGDGCGLDGDTPVLLVLPGVGGPGLASLRGGDDAGLG